MYSSIKTAIKAKLEAMTGIENVYGYEKGDLNGYPSAVVLLEGITADYETNQEDSRKYTFNIKIYQEMSDDGVGAEEAEGRLEALLDEVLEAYEDDWTLGGLCWKTNIPGIAGFTDRGMPTRVLEFSLECHAIYNLS